jgi:N utilization substance protein A
MTPEQLEAIEGIGPKTVEKISVAVNNYFATLEGGETVALPENEGEELPAEEAGAEAATGEEVSAEAESEPAQPEETPADSESSEATETEEPKE